MKTIIYHSNLSTYREYSNGAGIKKAVARLMEQYPNAVNVLSVIEGEQKERYLRYNPWLNPNRPDYDGDIELVVPYKDGYMVLRHLAVKPSYKF